MSVQKVQRMAVSDITGVGSFLKYCVLRPLQFSHEMVSDNRTGLVSATKVGFTVALIVSTIMLARLTETTITAVEKCTAEGVNAIQPLVSLIRDIFFLYIATFAATSLGSKWLMNHYNSKDKSTEGHEAEAAIKAGNEPRDPVGGEKPKVGEEGADL